MADFTRSSRDERAAFFKAVQVNRAGHELRPGELRHSRLDVSRARALTGVASVLTAGARRLSI